MGEIGQSLMPFFNCSGIDKGEVVPKADIMHVCFPYSDKFVDYVKEYQEKSGANLIIIHSTLPVGTTSKLGPSAVHSPVRGKHPNLTESIRTFKKFFGGPRAKEAAKIFSDLGVSVVISDKAENVEAMKLWDTEVYREAVLLNKKIYKYCQDNNLDFDIVYTQSNESYNEGYEKMGNPEYKKYILKYIEGPIGGHCLEPNHILLTKEEESQP